MGELLSEILLAWEASLGQNLDWLLFGPLFGGLAFLVFLLLLLLVFKKSRRLYLAVIFLMMTVVLALLVAFPAVWLLFFLQDSAWGDKITGLRLSAVWGAALLVMAIFVASHFAALQNLLKALAGFAPSSKK